MNRLLSFSLIVLGFSSCVPEKSYNCHCVYIPDVAFLPAGTPNKEEDHTIKSIVRDDAASDCSIDYEGKYFVQHYVGTCALTN
ncbi:MAG: hypothetical protein K9I70_02955 [Chitinophagaceae bacterium]|jgi:hypothetical protein|nr:hypothetical protein [Chitinophagaceae bacterium]